MSDLDDANTFNLTLGNTDWIDLAPSVQSAALARAAVYMRTRYHLRTELTDEQQKDVDTARWLIARDIAINPEPLPTRMGATVSKASAEVGGIKEATEYAVTSAPVDPYPNITAMLLPITVRISVANYWSGPAS